MKFSKYKAVILARSWPYFKSMKHAPEIKLRHCAVIPLKACGHLLNCAVGEALSQKSMCVYYLPQFAVEHLGKAQIDHLVINHKLHVCFVIETKMWAGIITGEYNDTYWQQNINGSVNYFKSPYKQNSYHCNVVRKYYSGYKLYNVIVFVRNKHVPRLKCIVDEDEVREYIIEKSNNIAKKLTLI
jgi:hypothetical protein